MMGTPVGRWRTLVGLGATSLLAIGPATATASTVSSTARSIVPEIAYDAGPGEVNDLSVAVGERGRRIFFADRGATIEPGEGCSGVDEATGLVRCRIPRIEYLHPLLSKLAPPLVVVQVELRDGDDRFDSSSLPTRMTTHSSGNPAVLLDLAAGNGVDALVTGPGDDRITPGPGDDAVLAGRGDDVFEGGRVSDGSDRLDGEGGVDAALFVRREMPLSLFLDGEPNDGEAGEGDNLLNTEDALGGRAGDVMSGDQGPNTLFGNGGDDELIGAGGEDVLFGDLRGLGADKVRGGAGHDVLFGGHGRDALLAGAGSDELDAATAFAGLGRDGDRDRVECGSGRERGVAEPKDRLHGCEDVRRVRPGRSETTRVPSIFRAPADRGLDRLSHTPRDRRIRVFLARAGR